MASDRFRWVDLLSAAAELAHKTRDRAESAAVAAGATDAEMPPQPELDTQLAEMLDAQGYKEQAKVNIMQLTDSHKWQLIKSYQQSLVDKAGDIRSQPEHWINILNIEPTAENLQELSVLLRQVMMRC